MSRSARWVLGAFALCFAFSFWLASALSAARPSLLERLLFCFCALIAVACFSQYLREMALRLIGGMVFVISIWYVLVEFKTEPHNLYSWHGPSVINSALFMLVFGLPGLYVALRGHYPKWGKGVGAFRRSNENTETSSPPLSGER